MRNLLSLAIVLALPAAASAAVSPSASGRNCLVSFSGAQQDVCTSTSSTSAPVLQSLLSLGAVKDSTLRLVKFGAPITKAQRAAVEAAGAKIISYAPHYAYIVRMAPGLDATMHAINGVIWSGPLMPALKVDPNIYSELSGNRIVDGLGISTLGISVDAQASGAMRRVIAAIPGLTVSNSVTAGGETRILASFERARLGAAIEELAVNPEVLSVGFRKPMQLSNSQGHWLHQSNVNTPTPSKPIWDKGLYGCGQIIGELDTGLWMDHVSFKDASQAMPISVCNDGAGCPGIATPNYDARKVIAYYKWSGLQGTSWDDNHGHGTHVAGSIVGNDNVANPGTDCANFTTPGGDTNLDGMAPGAKLVMQETGSSLAYLNTQGGTAYHMAQVAYDNGARLHSDSWGGGCTDQFGFCISGCTVTYDEFSRDADRVMWDHDDLLLVFAAGNDATACPNGNNVGSPGNAKNVLTIGASGRGTSGNNMASFSSRGPTLDARTKPDMTAQGSGIVSARRNTTNGTTSMSGTSMATPTASGHAALVRDYLARGFYPSGEKNPADAITNPSGALVKAIMTVGAFRMTGTGAGANPGQAQGFGRLLLKDSLHFMGDQRRLFIHDDRAGLATNDVHEQSLTVDALQPLTVVLTWTDAAAAVNASPATVNSLRLEVQAPNGDVWTQKLPAGYNVGNANPTQDITTSNYDGLNTLQRITLATPEAGTYQIRVRGINVPSGPQKFALAATGSFEPPLGVVHTVGGVTSGLSGTGLTLQLNDANDLAIDANGKFTFPDGLASGTAYAVTVAAQPSGQECAVANGSGTIADADVTDVEVTCVDKITDRIFADGFDGSGVEAAFSENFDAYAAGGNVHGQGGWKGWGNDPTAGATVIGTHSVSAPNSIRIEGDSDLIHEFSKFTSGSWTITANQFIPADFSGQTYFIFQNVYSDTDIGIISWSTQIWFDSAINEVGNEDGAANPFTAPLVKDRWVELKLVVDLDNDLQTFWYDGQQMYSGSWTNQFPGQGVPGIAAIGSIDLFANGASPVYYDDIRIVPTTR